MHEIKIVPKGWGFERWIVNKAEYCGKELFFIKGRKCSVHFHLLKDETFYIAEGELLVQYIEPCDWLHEDGIPATEYVNIWQDAKIMGPSPKRKNLILKPGDAFHVPIKMIHQMTGLLDTRMFEFSTQHFDSDSHRIIRGD